MPRLKPLSPDVLNTQQRELLDRLNTLLGFECNDWLTMARVPPIMEAAMSLCGAVLTAGEDCGEDLRWLVCYAASRAYGCQYCTAHTAYTATELGIQEDKLTRIDEFETCDAFSDPERAAIRVAIGMGKCPSAVSDADFDSLRAHFDEDQIVSIVALASMMGFFNRWNDTMATELETPPRDRAEQVLANTQWTLGKHGSDEVAMDGGSDG